MPKVGVVLSGCGVYDGSEIHEAVITLLVLAEQGAEAVCVTPDIEQAHVVNHLTGQESAEKRNVLAESARIARGKIRDIQGVRQDELDALIFPGGFGTAKNLCSFAFKGTECKVDPGVERLVREMHAAGKPIGALCIAPALVAKIFEGKGLRLTIGDEAETAQAIEKLGHQHVECNVHETCKDQNQNIISTPAYMLAKDLNELYAGIKKLVREVLSRVRK